MGIVDPRTQEEKRQQVMTLLLSAKTQEASNRWIARAVRVSPSLVAAVRYELETGRRATANNRDRRKPLSTPRLVYRGDAVYTMEIDGLAKRHSHKAKTRPKQGRRKTQ